MCQTFREIFVDIVGTTKQALVIVMQTLVTCVYFYVNSFL